jgi:RNA-directed DNA polymerase
METALGIRYRPNGKQEMLRVGKCAVIRYADDFVVMCDTEEEAKKAQEILAAWLAVRGLQLASEKTKIVTLAEGFDFLGFNVRIFPSKLRKSGWKVLIRPSKTSVTKIRKRLRDEWQSLHGHKTETVIKRLNPIIRGWSNYFRTQVSKATFNALDSFMFIRERMYAKHKHPNKPKYWIDQQYWGKMNLSRKDFWVFGDKETGNYLQKFAWTDIHRHTMVAGTNSPDDASLDTYWEHRDMAKAKVLPQKPSALAKRQGGKCPICGESLFIEEDIEKHHIVRRDEGGPDTNDNKILVHLYCHQQITAFQNRKP